MKRAVGGLVLLAVIAALAMLATTSAFAYNTATDTRDTSNGVAAGTGTLSVSTLNVASTANVIASFAANNVSSQTGVVSNTNIRTMYQQWRHNQQNDWFYVYAQNGATSITSATWDFYYYVPGRGYARLNNVASRPQTGNLTSQDLVTTYIFLTTGTNVPAFWVENIGVGGGMPFGPTVTQANNTFRVELGWGLGMQGFRNEGGTGTVAVLEAAETFPYPAGGVGTSRVFYDGWVPVNTGTPNLTLGNSAPTQAATGVTNASGSRNVNTATSYQSVQTVGDVDGDLSNASVIWLFTSGTQTGQWFQSGVYVNRAQSGYRIGTTATAYYQSWNEAISYTQSGAQMTTNYFTTLTVSATPAPTDRGGGQQALTSLTVTYNYVYSNSAKGGVTLWGRAEDFHGRSSGNVQVGTQTIS